MPRGVEVGLDPGDIVLDGDAALPTEKRHSTPPQFHGLRTASVNRGHVYCGEKVVHLGYC